MAAEPRLNPPIDDHMNLFPRLSAYPSLQLPPLQDPIPSLSASRPLPLEPSASANRDAHASSAQPYSISTSRGSAASRGVGSGGPATGEKVPRPVDEAAQGIEKPSLASSSTRDRDPREGAEETVESRQTAGSRKRQRVEQHDDTNKNYLQLPKMCKKRTHSGDAPLLAGLDHIVSPLNGPGATGGGGAYSAAPSAFEDAHGRNALNGTLAIIRETGSVETAETITKESREKASKREIRRPRRKWGEQETDHLLQGVALYGVGSWKKILEHPEFKFDARSSIDLKDRFRTCFPQEYRKHLDSKPSNSDPAEFSQRSTPKSRPLPSIISENILNLDDSPTSSTSAISPKEVSPSPSKRARKPRTDRKGTDDLARLGIAAPFRKAQRRERRAFTDEEDAALLRGFQMHGPLWSTIQSDPSLNLSSRRSMDVRDRFRNRYPEKYAEAGYKTRPKNYPKSPLRTHGKEGGEVPPISSASLSGGFDQGRPKENRHINTEEPQNPSQNSLLDFGDGTLPPFGQSAGESDIQRLLLDHIHPLATWNVSRAHLSTIDSQQPRNEPDQTIDPSSSQNPLHHQTSSATSTSTQQQNQQNQNQQPQSLPTLQKSTINPRSQPFPFLSTLPPLLDPLDSVFAHSASTFLNSGSVSGGDKYPAIAELMKLAGGDERRFGAGDIGGGVGLNWEDMATHPMFDIDTGGGISGGTGEDGVGRGR